MKNIDGKGANLLHLKVQQLVGLGIEVPNRFVVVKMVPLVTYNHPKILHCASGFLPNIPRATMKLQGRIFHQHKVSEDVLWTLHTILGWLLNVESFN